MENNSKDQHAIEKVLKDLYFKGIYEGDTSLLRQAFHEGTMLFGDVNGQPYAKTLDRYLEGVASRVSPKNSGKPFKATVLAIDVINSIATAKLNVQMYDFNYFNFLTLHQVDGRWLIISKTLTDVR
jgi:hypothetical protein